MQNKIRNFLSAFRRKYDEAQGRRAFILLCLQAGLIAALIATTVLICIVDRSGRFVFYFTLVVTVLILLSIALKLNLSGKYFPSALLTMILIISGPWVSYIFDPSVAKGDFIPLIYLAVSIQLCALLTTEKITLAVAVLQLGMLIVLILMNPALRAINWPSLIIYILITATIGVITSFSFRKQLEQLERHHNNLLSSEKQLRIISVRDSLTGLYNRRYLEETLERDIDWAVRENQSLAVIMADVDEFKVINDNYGHISGDTLLCQIADIIKLNIRHSDAACRYGGDEFIFILTKCTVSEAAAKAEVIRKAIEDTVFTFGNGESGRVTMSFGVAGISEDIYDAGMIMMTADKALYESKKGGRNRVTAV